MKRCRLHYSAREGGLLQGKASGWDWLEMAHDDSAWAEVVRDKNGQKCGFLARTKTVKGFQTGDFVRAVIPFGKKQGTHVGRVAVRATGSFNIQTSTETVQGIGWRYCQLLQRSDGYHYITERRVPLPSLGSKAGVSSGVIR